MGDMSSIISGVSCLPLYAVLLALVSRLSASSVSRADADSRPLSGALCARCGLLLKIT